MTLVFGTLLAACVYGAYRGVRRLGQVLRQVA